MSLYSLTGLGLDVFSGWGPIVALSLYRNLPELCVCVCDVRWCALSVCGCVFLWTLNRAVAVCVGITSSGVWQKMVSLQAVSRLTCSLWFIVGCVVRYRWLCLVRWGKLWFLCCCYQSNLIDSVHSCIILWCDALVWITRNDAALCCLSFIRSCTTMGHIMYVTILQFSVFGSSVVSEEISRQVISSD